MTTSIASHYESIKVMKELLTPSFLLAVAQSDGEIIEVNENFRNAFGYEANRLTLASFQVLETNAPTLTTWKHIFLQANETDQWVGGLHLRTEYGEYVELQCTVIPFNTIESKHSRFLLVFAQVTNQNEVDKWRELACTHEVSNVPNRQSFQLEIESILQRADLCRLKVAILYMDIDNFKQINDTYGHSSGNEVLQELARRFKEYAYEGNYIFHFSGDEFVMLQYFDESFSETVEAILAMCHEPFLMSKGQIAIDVSIGASIYPVHGENIDTLLDYADTEMYVSKQYTGTKINLHKSHSIVWKEEAVLCTN